MVLDPVLVGSDHEMDDDGVLENIDQRIVRHGVGMKEQLGMLRRAKKVDAQCFFDFEASPFNKHEAYCVSFNYGGETKSIVGRDCAKLFLDDLLDRFGLDNDPTTKWGSDLNNLPQVQILAHNITYDASFIFKHLKHIKTVEKSTRIIMGSAVYSMAIDRHTGSPNQQLNRWLVESKQTSRGFESKVARLVKILNRTKVFITSAQQLKAIVGVGCEVMDVLEKASFDSFKPEEIILRKYRSVKLIFKDTCMMIPMKLDDFGKSFSLDQAKQIMPHTLMTQDFVSSGGLASREDLQKHVPADMQREFFEQVAPFQNQNGLFDMLRYSSYYCSIDVDVLKAGWDVFRLKMLTAFNLDINHFPTIASMADQYFIDRRCYDLVEEVSVHVQHFIQACSVGGRVMCANNLRVSRDIELADFDAVSLYPSAMLRLANDLGGFLKGRPFVWAPDVVLDDLSGYFLKIRVTKVGKCYRFPIASIRTDLGRNWTNDLEGQEIFVDKITLEDLVKFQLIEYEIIQGYCYNQGRNSTIGDVVQFAFDERRRIKKNDKTNPLQLIIKLILNSGYGKNGLKAVETDVSYVNDDHITNHTHANYNKIKQMYKMENDEWRVEKYKEIDTHFNRQHVACEILSMSKRIMNEVMCLAEDLGVEIDYQDTDSMHLPMDQVGMLGSEFQKLYNRVLIGEEMGQFHVDFAFENAKPQGEIRAVQSIFLGKKSYIDKLCDDAGHIEYHIRMKGIPNGSIWHVVREQYDGDPMALYRDLYGGKSVEFDLNKGACAFKTGKDHTTSTVAMKRTICFPV